MFFCEDSIKKFIYDIISVCYIISVCSATYNLPAAFAQGRLVQSGIPGARGKELSECEGKEGSLFLCGVILCAGEGAKVLLDRLEVGSFATNCYLVACSKTREAVIIDPGDEGGRIIKRVQELKLRVKYVLNTHAHIDHIGANDEVRAALKVPLLAHAADLPRYRTPQASLALFRGRVEAEPPDRFLEEGDVLEAGTLKIKVLETPGHSPGGITLDINGVLFVGDTLFAGSIGRTDFPGGSYQSLIQNIKEKILIYPDDTEVFPGHGPPTTVGDERRYNPFLVGSF